MAKKVLIAEDKEQTAKVLVKGLKIAGYEVAEARDGEEALKMAKELVPDLIILDIMMPKMDGFTVNLKLKENDTTRNIPVIISSTKGAMSEVFEYHPKAKIDGFLEKPYTLEELWSKIKEVVKE